MPNSIGCVPNGTSNRKIVILYGLRRNGLGLPMAVFLLEFKLPGADFRAVAPQWARTANVGAARVRILQARAL